MDEGPTVDQSETVPASGIEFASALGWRTLPPDEPVTDVDAAMDQVQRIMATMGYMHALAGIAFYRFTVGGRERLLTRDPWDLIDQFHVEFLQALVITRSGLEPTRTRHGPTLSSIGELEAATIAVTTAALRAGPRAGVDAERGDLALLAGELAGESMMVRNWAHPRQMFQLGAALLK
jgi:hypothetical protein